MNAKYCSTLTLLLLVATPLQTVLMSTDFSFSTSEYNPMHAVTLTGTNQLADPSVSTLNSTWGGSMNEVARSIAVDSLGNSYLAGSTSSYSVKPPYPNTILLKYNSTGALNWTRTWGGNQTEEAYGVTVDPSNNVYVAGSSESFRYAYNATYNVTTTKVLLLKYYSNGTIAWDRTWGGLNPDYGYALASDSLGNIYVTGQTVSFGSTNQIFLLKYDSTGSLLCQKTWGFGTIQDRGNGITVDSSGNVYVVGTTTSTLTGQDVFIAKFDSSCSQVKAESWGSTGSDSGSAIAYDPASSNLYVTGYTTSLGYTNKAFLLKLDLNLNLIWTRFWGGTNDEYAYGVAVDSPGNVTVTGATSSFGSGSDVFMLKFSRSGNQLYQAHWGGAGNDGGFGVAFDASNNPVIAGYVSEASPYQIKNATGSLTSQSNATINFLSLGPVSRTQLTSKPSGTISAPAGSQTYGGGEDTVILKVYLASAPPIAPSAPQSLQATNQNGEVNLTWLPAASNGSSPITSYRIYRGTSHLGENSTPMHTTLNNVTKYLDTAVTLGVTYYYQVTAVSPVGESLPSSEAHTTPSVKPGTPQNPQAVGMVGKILVSWSPPASNGGSAITNYTLYRATVSGNEALLVELSNVTSYTDSAVITGTTYFYKVAAINSQGQSPLSSETSASPVPGPTPPSKPLNLTAIATPGVITLNWKPPLYNGGSPILYYYVYRSTTQGVQGSLLAQLANVTSYQDRNFTLTNTYYYTVTALNTNGESPPSNQVPATPVGGASSPPSAPQNLQASASANQIILTWSPPTQTGGVPVAIFKVFRSTSAGAENLTNPLALVPGIETSYNDTSADPGVRYYYKVTALTIGGESSPSNEANAMIPPTSLLSGNLLLYVAVAVIVILGLSVAYLLLRRKGSKLSPSR